MRFPFSVFALAGLLLCQAEQIDCQTEECDASTHPDDMATKAARVPDTCTLVYAPFSSTHGEDSGEDENATAMQKLRKSPAKSGTKWCKSGAKVVQAVQMLSKKMVQKWCE